MSAAVMAIVLVMAIVVFFTGSPSQPAAPSSDEADSAAPFDDAEDPDDTGEADSANAPVVTTPSPRTTAVDGPCPELPTDDRASPVTQPDGTLWIQTQETLLPYAPNVGPAVATDEMARCYAHTPTGAVFAAVQAAWRYRRSENWGTVAQHLLAPGPGRDAYIAQRTARTGANATAGPPGESDDGGVPLDIGFRVTEYTPERARIGLVNQRVGGAGPPMHTVWTVVWTGGDWKIELPAGGAAPPSERLPDTEPYISWDLSTTVREQSE